MTAYLHSTGSFQADNYSQLFKKVSAFTGLISSSLYCGVLPKARTVKPQKPRNTQATIEVLSVYCLLLGNARNSRNSSHLAPPRSLLCNADVNTSLQQLVATQQ
jgi:hypothetical protein